MRVAIIGSRDYPDLDTVRRTARWLVDNGHHVVTGGARGVDTAAEQEAKAAGQQPTVHLPVNGTAQAKMARNTVVVDDADSVIAFWDGHSRGTHDAIRKAVRAGKVVRINPVPPKHEGRP